MRIAVTGSSGFVGSNLVPVLERRGHVVVRAARAEKAPRFDYLDGCEAVIHLAAIAHQRHVEPVDFDNVNHKLPVEIACAAVEAGVPKFVFVSSVAVEVSPESPYGASKAAAETDLSLLSGIEVIVVRPPLVYGRGAPGNMGSLMKLSRLPIPLPLGSADRKRSLVFVGNLVDALAFVAEQSKLEQKIFTVTDSEDVSLREIVTSFRKGMGRKPWLFDAPWLEAGLRMVGGGEIATKMLGALCFDGSAMRNAGWVAPFHALAALEESARPPL